MLEAPLAEVASDVTQSAYKQLVWLNSFSTARLCLVVYRKPEFNHIKSEKLHFCLPRLYCLCVHTGVQHELDMRWYIRLCTCILMSVFLCVSRLPRGGWQQGVLTARRQQTTGSWSNRCKSTLSCCAPTWRRAFMMRPELTYHNVCMYCFMTHYNSSLTVALVCHFLCPEAGHQQCE